MKKIKEVKYHTIPFKHGERVTCYIQGKFIEDAMVSINETGEVFICQNKKCGQPASDKLGYKCSWAIFQPNNSTDFEKFCRIADITELKSAEPLVTIKSDDDILTAEYDQESVELLKKGAIRI